jgi:hypothetical protein
MEICLNNYNNETTNNKLIKVVLSDRLTKDVESLLNSTYWVDGLKSRKAIGIGDQLYCNLFY